MKKNWLLSNFKKEVGIFTRKPRNLNLSCELKFQPKKLVIFYSNHIKHGSLQFLFLVQWNIN